MVCRRGDVMVMVYNTTGPAVGRGGEEAAKAGSPAQGAAGHQAGRGHEGTTSGEGNRPAGNVGTLA